MPSAGTSKAHSMKPPLSMKKLVKPSTATTEPPVMVAPSPCATTWLVGIAAGMPARFSMAAMLASRLAR